MTLLEMVCVIWLTAVMGASVAATWTTAFTALRLIQQQEIADDCADNAAELYFEQQTIPSSFVVNGRVCTVEVMSGELQESGVTVVATCGNRSQTLWLPNPKT